MNPPRLLRFLSFGWMSAVIHSFVISVSKEQFGRGKKQKGSDTILYGIPFVPSHLLEAPRNNDKVPLAYPVETQVVLVQLERAGTNLKDAVQSRLSAWITIMDENGENINSDATAVATSSQSPVQATTKMIPQPKTEGSVVTTKTPPSSTTTMKSPSQAISPESASQPATLASTTTTTVSPTNSATVTAVTSPHRTVIEGNDDDDVSSRQVASVAASQSIGTNDATSAAGIENYVASSTTSNNNSPDTTTTDPRSLGAARDAELETAVASVKEAVVEMEQELLTSTNSPTIDRAVRELETAVQDFETALQTTDDDAQEQRLLVAAETELETAIEDMETALLGAVDTASTTTPKVEEDSTATAATSVATSQEKKNDQSDLAVTTSSAAPVVDNGSQQQPTRQEELAVATTATRPEGNPIPAQPAPVVVQTKATTAQLVLEQESNSAKTLGQDDAPKQLVAVVVQPSQPPSVDLR